MSIERELEDERERTAQLTEQKERLDKTIASIENEGLDRTSVLREILVSNKVMQERWVRETREAASLQTELQELSELRDTGGPEVVEKLNKEIAALTSEKQAIETDIEAVQADGTTAVAVTNAKKAARSRAEHERRVDVLKHSIAALQASIATAAAENAEDGGKNGRPSTAEMRAYKTELLPKLKRAKELNRERSAITAELDVVGNTIKILKRQTDGAEEALSEYEKRHGVEGFTRTKDEVEELSKRKDELDKVKGKTMAEITTLVRDYTVKLNEKKEALKPLEMEVNALTSQFVELRGRHREEKAKYRNAMTGLKSDEERLQSELHSALATVSSEQSRLFEAQMVQGLQLVDEARARSAREGSAVRQKLTDELDRMKRETAALERQRSEVSDAFEPSKAQVASFKHLVQLLRIKQASLKTVGRGNGNLDDLGDVGDGDDGSNRLVF